MKIRNGFVSNSSTSSFTCDVCGEEYTGWDACPDRFDCSTCENEHVMCNSHLEGIEIEPSLVEGCEHTFDRESYKSCPECGEASWVESDDYQLSAKSCPVCTFNIYADGEMAKYLEKTRGVSRADVFAKIKAINKRRRKLYDNEYITSVCEQFQLNDTILLKEIKEKFGTFDKYYDFIHG